MSQQRTVKITQPLPATSLKNREINVTASSGKAEREVNEIMEIKRREPIALIWVKLSKHKSELPKFTTVTHSPFLVSTLKSVHQRQENDDVMFLGDTDQYVYFSRHFG